MTKTQTKTATTPPAPEDSQVTPAQLRADLRILLQDAQELLTDTTRDTFHEKAEEARQAIDEKMAALRAMAERGREEFLTREEEFEDFVARKPLTAVGGAFALGYILSRICRNSD